MRRTFLLLRSVLKWFLKCDPAEKLDRELDVLLRDAAQPESPMVCSRWNLAALIIRNGAC